MNTQCLPLAIKYRYSKESKYYTMSKKKQKNEVISPSSSELLRPHSASSDQHHQSVVVPSISTARQNLLNWLKLFRAECECLHILVRGGLRDNALHNSIFHKESSKCCRLLGLWYRNFKKEIVFHFIQNAELFRKKKRQAKSLKRLMAKKKKNEKENKKQQEGAGGNSSSSLSLSKKNKKKKAKKETTSSSSSSSSVRGKKSFENNGFGKTVFIRSKPELVLRKKILTYLVRAGWACTAELQSMRANTNALAISLIASLARMHKLMSSSSSSADKKTNATDLENHSKKEGAEEGLFGKWLLV